MIVYDDQEALDDFKTTYWVWEDKMKKLFAKAVCIDDNR